jgi:hypothetical protein
MKVPETGDGGVITTAVKTTSKVVERGTLVDVMILIGQGFAIPGTVSRRAVFSDY